MPSVLADAEILERLRALPGWEYAPGKGIQKDYRFSNFAAAIAFINRVADVSEARNHHPELSLHGWNKVTVTFITHSANGVTARDFEMAAQVEPLAG